MMTLVVLLSSVSCIFTYSECIGGYQSLEVWLMVMFHMVYERKFMCLKHIFIIFSQFPVVIEKNPGLGFTIGLSDSDAEDKVHLCFLDISSFEKVVCSLKYASCCILPHLCFYIFLAAVCSCVCSCLSFSFFLKNREGIIFSSYYFSWPI